MRIFAPMIDLKRILLHIIPALVLTACSEESPEPVLPEPNVSERTVLVYMVADNNLSGYSTLDLEEMKTGIRDASVPENCRWTIYYSGPDHKPRLMEIGRDGKETTLAEYPASETSVSIGRMRKVIDDSRRLAPARSYGLVLWSHGSGWLSEPGSLDELRPLSSETIAPLSFGYDGPSGLRMKISSLAQALDGHHFDFIYFDCCHMATAEVAYQLRHAADIMVASATELGVEGMPYDINVALLLNGLADRAAAATFKYYSDRYNSGDGYGCSISVLDLTAMDALAGATRKVLLGNTALPQDYRPVCCFRRNVVPEGIYDFDHYIKALCDGAVDRTLYSQWRHSFDAVVTYHASTPRVYFLDSSDFAGLACNIIRSQEELDLSGDTYGYRQTAWWADVISIVFN